MCSSSVSLHEERLLGHSLFHNVTDFAKRENVFHTEGKRSTRSSYEHKENNSCLWNPRWIVRYPKLSQHKKVTISVFWGDAEIYGGNWTFAGRILLVGSKIRLLYGLISIVSLSRIDRHFTFNGTRLCQLPAKRFINCIRLKPLLRNGLANAMMLV